MELWAKTGDVMKAVTKVIIWALLCCLLFVTPAYSCTLGLRPITKFDPAEYVFIGQVTGIVGPFESKKFQQQAWGLQIKLKEKVYLPQTPADLFEVFPFQLGADCSTFGTSSETLAKHYPVGSEVKVIARRAQLLPSNSAGDNIRLEIVPGDLSDISGNRYEDGRQMAEAQTEFDYRSFKKPTPADYIDSFMPFLDAQGALPEFELRKDLLRLSRARSSSLRIRILERLLYYPTCCGDGDYDQIATHYLRNPKLARALIRKRQALTNLAN